MKRTFAGVQFVRKQDGYSRPGDGLPHWVSESGIKLFCTVARNSLDPNWEVTLPNGRRDAGISAEDALMNVGFLPRK